MSKQSEAVKLWRRNTKKKLIESMGNCCQICGYNKSQEALELHHLNPSEKDFSIGQVISKPISWSKIVEEAKKCVLLCSNCHKEVHYGVSTVPENFVSFDESLSVKPLYFTYCPICNKPKNNINKFCSLSCSSKSRRKVNWDSVDLLKLVNEDKRSFVSIGDELNCSDAAVRKRYIKLMQNCS